MTENKHPAKYYLSNRDLLVIAILSGIGGVMSTYIGYLGNLLNRLLGVPFGAGQFVSGLHVFWFILVAGLIRKPGAATAAGLLKGIIELLTGSTHGIAIVLVSLMQGLIVDLVLLVTRRHNLGSYMLAGGISAASNVFVFQILYFSGVPIAYLLLIGFLAFVSGVLLAGSFGHSVLEIVLLARPFRISGATEEGTAGITAGNGSKVPRLNLGITALLVAAFSVGAVYYFAAVFEPPWIGPQCQVEGAVESPLAFNLAQFNQHTTTITAELKGQVSYIPPREYTGVPLRIIIEEASPREGAQKLKVMATDGYMVEFELAKVLKDDQMLLIREEDMLRLIAGNYDGGYWVKFVNRIVVE
ncbi:MAG: ECF transporter S component [Syntrophomonadaceae bacterium]|jgi:ABC-type thiamin/hydroxymethylpyrimidine transport system permease subunit